MKPIRPVAFIVAALLPAIASTVAFGLEPQPVNQEPVADFSIVNGEFANDQDVPGYIQMGVRESGDDYTSHNCGASILNKEWVLTAAHCVWNRDRLESRGEVVALPASLFRFHHPVSGENRRARQIIIHPDMRYDANAEVLTWHNDIALIKLDKPLQTNQRMTIAAPNMVTLRAGHATVWGRGAITLDADGGISGPYERILTRRADVPLNKPEYCGSGRGADGMLCAEAPSLAGLSPASCFGDSGGPLTIFNDSPQTMIQVGLVSNAENVEGMALCGGQPTWYTNLSHHANWIKGIAQDVTFAAFGVEGPDGPAVPVSPQPNPLPSPQPGPPASLQCGSVEDNGSALPFGFGPSTRWRPMRGQSRGSDVSIVASTLAWPTGDYPGTALIAGECAWADALAATSMVKYGPLLLTDPSQLEPAIMKELQRLQVDHVLIVGGPVAVSPAVENALTSMGINVTRLQGASRIQTAARVAEFSMFQIEGEGFTIARGYPAPGGSPSQAFADSMAGAYFAPWMNAPMVLTASDQLSPEVSELLTTYNPRNVALFGGQAALSSRVEQEVKRIIPTANFNRFAGASRADTAYWVGSGMMNFPGPRRAAGVMVIEGQADDAWKVGFTFAPLAAKNQYVYALASGDVLAPESKQLIQEARRRNLPVTCVASDRVCAMVDSI